MTQWYVKDLSKITHVSVQTLHHYDRIGLLKPSVRLPNGYRVYSEKDLLTLQQIIALKFFGFELAQIKKMLNAELDVVDHFSAQARFLDEKAKMYEEASDALRKIISDCSHNKSIPWETIIKTIEVYRMTQELEKTWAGKALSPEELQEYARFEQNLKTRFTDQDQKRIENEWHALVDEINANFRKDPTSEFGIALGMRCMTWVNNLYGKQISLRNAIWEKGFKGGHAHEEHGLTPEAVAWLDQAIDAYYRNRIYNVLNQVETKPHNEVLKSWNELLTDMCGDIQASKDEIYEAVMKEKDISPAAKNWLKKISKR